MLVGQRDSGAVAPKLRETGFGKEVRADRLIEQDHGVCVEDGNVRLREGLLRRFEPGELAHLAGDIEREAGNAYVPTGPGGTIEGVVPAPWTCGPGATR